MYPSVLKSEAWLKLMAERRFEKPADLLYFSASPNAAIAPKDTNRRTISEMLEIELGNYSVQAFDTGAIHAGIFLKALENLPFRPKAIVMDLNLRSFGMHWIESPLENSLQRNMAYWNSNFGLLNRMQVVLKNYPYKTPSERLKAIKYAEEFKELELPFPRNTIKNWMDSLVKQDEYELLGRDFIRNFAVKIDANNTMLQYYEAVVLKCQRQKIPLFLCILPEDLEGMQRRVGEELVELCQKNVQFLQKKLTGDGVYILDLSAGVSEKYFFENSNNFATEHYSQEGRTFVAKKQAQLLRAKLK